MHSTNKKQAKGEKYILVVPRVEDIGERIVEIRSQQV
jgi:hypothetical protein